MYYNFLHVSATLVTIFRDVIQRIKYDTEPIVSVISIIV